MAKFYLLNNTRVGSLNYYAGSLIDDTNEPAAAIRSAGGVLITSTHGPAAAAAALAQKLRKRGAPIAYLAEIMQSALDYSHERWPKGANLGDTSPTLAWSDGRRVQPAASLSANRTVTLGVAAGADGRLPTAGARWEFTRLDTGAFTLAFVNGGPGAGTLRTLPVSAVGSAVFEFNGTDWEWVA